MRTITSLLLLLGVATTAGQTAFNWTSAVIELRSNTPRLGNVASVLQRALCDRLLLSADRRCFPVVQAPAPVNASGVISLAVSGDGTAESFILLTSPRGVDIVGTDLRGALFGAGHLLKTAALAVNRTFALPVQRSFTLPGLPIQSSPVYPVRMHQIGYRALNNAYDAMTLETLFEHLTQLALFGMNGVELTVTNDMVFEPFEDGPLFRLDPPSWLASVSAFADSLDLNVGLWYGLELTNYSDPTIMAQAVAIWHECFTNMPRVDSVFIPGGDPGGHDPSMVLFAAQALKSVLAQRHPTAEVWVSLQNFYLPDMDTWFTELAQPGVSDWLSGLVYGPWTTIDLPEFMNRTPRGLKIRLYPDICHSVISQYVVPGWDPAHAMTAYREAINIRPLGHASIAMLTLPGTVGFGAYSEGVNDDVAKAVWTAAGWLGAAFNSTLFLSEYVNFFMGSSPAAEIKAAMAQLLAGLEQNWVGPLANNTSVENSLALADYIDAVAPPSERTNWRLLQMLYRARYDAYSYYRLIYENEGEAAAMAALATAPSVGSIAAMAAAKSALDAAVAAWRGNANMTRLRSCVDRHGALIFALINAQMSVPLYNAINTERGATLDTLEVPLNNAPFLVSEFVRIGNLPSETDRLTAIATLVNWESVKPGDFYDDLGVHGKQPHLMPGPGFDTDPGFLRSAMDVTMRMNTQSAEPLGPPPTFPLLPRQWGTLSKTLYATPMLVSYDGLPAGAGYNVTVVYGGRTVGLGSGLMHLSANGVVVHGGIAPPNPMAALTFAVPLSATSAGGTLTLNCTREWTDSTSSTGCAIAEIRLIRTR